MTTPSPKTLFCANHPDRETLLRCNRCEKPICTQCAVLTPTGYRCRECVRGQQKSFETALPIDYVIAPLAAAGLAFIGSWLVRFTGFFTIFLAPFAGMIIAEAVKAAVPTPTENLTAAGEQESKEMVGVIRCLQQDQITLA